MAFPVSFQSPNPEIMQADRDVAALLAKMGHRVADNGFYIPSPLCPPQPGEAFNFPATAYTSQLGTTSPSYQSARGYGASSYYPGQGQQSSAHACQGYQQYANNCWSQYICEGYAPPTPRSQQRAVADHVYARYAGTPTATPQYGNYFQFPAPVPSNKTPAARRHTIPQPVPSRTMTPPAALLKEEPIDPRYCCDVVTADASFQNGQRPLSLSSGDSGYQSILEQTTSEDVISPTASESSLATVEDILKSCLNVLGDCDLPGMNQCTQPLSSSCEDILSPNVIPSDITPVSPMDAMTSPGLHELSPVPSSSDYYSEGPADVSSGLYAPPHHPVDLHPFVIQPAYQSIPSIPDGRPQVDPNMQMYNCLRPSSRDSSTDASTNDQIPHLYAETETPFKLDPVPTQTELAAKKRTRRAGSAKSKRSAPYTTTSTPLQICPATKSKRASSRKPEHPCQYCARSFTSVSGLKQHENTHTGARPYKCDFCPQTFAQRSTLRTHRRSIHTKERPYQCGFCDLAFSDYSTHVKHERTHTGNKPYQCHICGRAFSQSGNLYRHQSTKHSIKPVLIKTEEVKQEQEV